MVGFGFSPLFTVPLGLLATQALASPFSTGQHSAPAERAAGDICTFAEYNASIPGRVQPTAGQEFIGYATNWKGYSRPGGYSDDLLSKLTSIRYAFASVSHSTELDKYYVQPTDFYADFQRVNGLNAGCIPIDKENLCDNGAILAFAPYVAARKADGSCPTTKPTGCENSGGSQAAPRTCFQSLDVSSGLNTTCGATVPAACGWYGYFLSDVRKKYSNISIILSIGGWSDSQYFTEVAKDQYRSDFVDSVVHYINFFGFDGVDIDWEYPGQAHDGQVLPGEKWPNATYDTDVIHPLDSRKADFANFGLLLKELRAKLSAEKKITLAVSAAPEQAEQYGDAVCPYVDGIAIMTYDFHGAANVNTTTGAHNNLYEQYSDGFEGTDGAVSLNSSVYGYDGLRGWLREDAGCTKDKLTLGVAWYPKVYGQVTEGNTLGYAQPFAANGTAPANYCYGDIVQDGQQFKFGRIESNGNMSFLYHETNKTFMSFDDPLAAQTKAQWIKDNGFNGVMIWSLEQDDTKLRLSRTLDAVLKGDSAALAAIPPLGFDFQPIAAGSNASDTSSSNASSTVGAALAKAVGAVSAVKLTN